MYRSNPAGAAIAAILIVVLAFLLFGFLHSPLFLLVLVLLLLLLF